MHARLYPRLYPHPARGTSTRHPARGTGGTQHPAPGTARTQHPARGTSTQHPALST